MRYFFPFLYFIFFMICFHHAWSQNMMINEMMSSNAVTLADEDGDYSDWIELYNAGSNAVQLEGWGLTDNKSNPFKWIFPGKTLAPKQYLVIRASGKNYRPAEGERVQGLLREVYADIPGTEVQLLTQHPSYPGAPSSSQRIKARFEAPTDVSSNYGQRMHGYIKPPVTGSFTFWISSDDNGQLWLSTNDSPGNAKKIAEVPGWTNPQEWNKYAQQKSAQVFLEKGKYYYISALMKEGTGGDNLAVGWQWPDGTSDMPVSGQYLFCSEGELHTNYSLSSEGEEIVLTNPQGVKVDEFLPVKLKSDISFGRTPDGSQVLKYFNEPTPGKSNNTPGFNEILLPPVFSHSGGFYRDPFSLSLSSAPPGVSIVYTLDGSEPDLNQLTGVSYPYLNKYRQNPNTGAGPMLYRSYRSNTYKSPVSVKDRTSDVNQISQVSTTYDTNPWYFPSVSIDKAVVVRARTVKDGALSSDVVSNSYFVRLQGQNPYLLPVISFCTREDALFDFYKGIYVAGIDFENWRSSNPSATANGGSSANYHREGDEWEYPAHFELFDKDGNRVLAQNVGFRMHGNWSNSSPFKSLRIYARNEYGKSYLNYPFFKTRSDSAFKRIILRNSGNDIWYTMFRDAAMQDMTRHMNFETQAYQPTVLFINGEYWGIHNIRERYDKYYLTRIFGVNEEQVDILENNMSVDEGENTHYAETMAYINQNGVRDANNYDFIKTRIDIDSYIDYMIAQIFMVNTDWPGNNIKYWRLQTSQYLPGAGAGKDGRWRWMLYDADYTFGIYTPTEYNKNMMTFTTQTNGPAWPNPDWSTLLYRKLLENESFKTAFIVRFCDELNTAFKTEVVTFMINKMQIAIEPEMVRHILRWKMPSSISGWYNNVNQLRSFAEQRPSYARNHLRQFFNLSADFTLTVNVSDPNQGHVVVNTIPLVKETRGVAENPYPWQGLYFRNVPLRLEAVPAPGYEFVKWTSVNGTYTNSVIVLKPSGNLNITAVFQKMVQENLLPPVITQPQANAVVENSTSFQWVAVNGALRYELQIADNAGFINPFFVVDTLTTVGQTVTLPKSETGYFVRVRAITTTGPGDWSATVAFRTGITPAAMVENQASQLMVYPNPFRQCITLDLYLSKSGNVEMVLFNMAGKKIKMIARENLPSGIHTFRIPGDQLAPGPYFIICSTESDIFRQKLVKY